MSQESQSARETRLELWKAQAEVRRLQDEKQSVEQARLDTASGLEFLVTFVVLFSASTVFLLQGPDTWTDYLIYQLKSPLYLSLLAATFAEIFIHSLTGHTILVGLYAWARQKRRMHLAMAFPSEPTNDNTLVPSIEREFNRFILRSDETFRIAQRRPNALLIVGTAVAISGLLFFIVTLPGFVIDREARGEIVSINDIYRTLFDLTPRLLMLVFIQLLAGFFLRQYRVSMEDLRYFEAVLRGREAQFVSYCILSGSAGDKLAEFAASLAESKDREFLRLQQGETTVVLETQKIEANEFKTLAEKLFDFTKSLAQRGPGDKPAPS